MSETPGFEDYEVSLWSGVLAPAGTPAPVVERISAEMKDILAQPDIQEKLLNVGAIAHYEDPAQMGERIKQDYERWGALIREKGIATQ